MRRALVVLLVTAIWLPATQATAQFWDKLTNPTINVPIQHPPGLGLQINKVAFGPAKGEAAEQFIDALTEQFVRANIEVVERAQLEALLAEHNFTLSGYVDSASATEMGKILGPSVLVFVNVPRHQAQQKKLYDDWKDGKGLRHRTYISRTQAFAKGSVRAVDLATGRVFAAQTLEASPLLENKAEDCCPEFPSDMELLDLAMSQMVGQAQRLFLPWRERSDLYFFDDKDCNLKTAHAFMKAGNVEAALQQSLTNVAGCKGMPKAKDKNLFHANYNVGMGYFATGQFDKALEYLSAAQQAKPNDITTKAIGECMRAKSLATEMQRVEERMTLDATTAARRAEHAPTSPSVPPSRTPTGATAKAPAARTAPAATASPGVAGSSIEERLQKLEGLLKKGLITKPEYDKKRADLLKEL